MGKLLTCYAPFRRSPPEYCYPALPLDLHVLSLPLAFILSQDQTLLCIFFIFLSLTPDTLNSLKELTLSFFFFSVLACTCSSLFNDLSLRSRDPFRPLRCTRSPNGIAKVLLFFYSANFFRIFLKFFLSPHHITPPGPPEAGPGCSILATEMILRRRNRCCRDRLGGRVGGGMLEGWALLKCRAAIGTPGKASDFMR